MPDQVLVYIGSALIFLWGAGHLMPTKSIVAGFGALSDDNRRIITMEWIAEGLALCFIGVLAFLTVLVGNPGNQVAIVVIRALAVMLLVMAALSAFTGARTPILPMKLCPFVKTGVALLFFIGSV
ncbi:hypothetical protein ACFLT7_03625 [candidate division KSB1 bacterium]